MAKNDQHGRNLNIRINRGESGMFFATSEDEPTFFLAQRTLKALMAALPSAVEETLRELHQQDVSASPATKVDNSAACVRVYARSALAELR